MRSDGNCETLVDSARHQTSAATMAMKLKAFNMKGAVIPNATINTPASAGPMARLTLMPMELSAMAEASFSRGTRGMARREWNMAQNGQRGRLAKFAGVCRNPHEYAGTGAIR
jgi:hypothetical protein